MSLVDFSFLYFIMLFLESGLTVSLGSMDVKVCLCLLILGAVCCTARELAAPDLLIKETTDVSGTFPILLLPVPMALVLCLDMIFVIWILK